MNGKTSGYTRKRLKKNFIYFDSKGKRITSKLSLERIKALVIPPAWENVWICASSKGHIQVTGFDVKGRKQYRYHAEWNKARNENKFSKMQLFAQKLPLIRTRVQKDLKEPGLGRNKVLALVVKIMEQTLIRVGNDEYAKTNHSYGLTTIRNTHVKVRGARVVFNFKGKSGKQHLVELNDKQMAPLVRRCQDLPGQELFCYTDDRGKIHDVKSQDVNDYLKEITQETITAKDFRTWGGTVCAALFLKDQAPPKSQSEQKKTFVRTVLHTSETLRNTPAICRRYYIHPCVFEAYTKGTLKRAYVQCKCSKSIRGLHMDEIFTRHLLNRFT